MPWTGPNFIRHNEDYSGASVWQSDAAASILIQSVRHDYHDFDIANGIDACINKNGANSPAANLDWGGFKITDYGTGGNAPSAASDVARYGQTVTAASLNAGTNVLTLTRADGNVTVDLTPLVIGGSTANFAKLDSANEFQAVNTFDSAPVSKAGFTATPASGPVSTWRVAPDNAGKMAITFSGTYNGSALELIASGGAGGTGYVFGSQIALQSDLATYIKATDSPSTSGNWTNTGSWNFSSGSVVLPSATTFGASGGAWQTASAASTFQLFSVSTGDVFQLSHDATDGMQGSLGGKRIWNAGNFKLVASGVPTGGVDGDLAVVQTGGSKGLWNRISGVWTLIAS